MWYDLYTFIDFLNENIENYPTKAEFKIKMDKDLYNFFTSVNFISSDLSGDHIDFKGRIFYVNC